MENGKHPVYEFGGFQLDPLRHTLFRQGRPVALAPKLFETLVLLVENRDRVLPKDEMMQTLWAETFVEEGNLSQNIFMLRKTLGDDRNGHSFIHTIPRRGYRFVAPVVEAEAEAVIQIPGAPRAQYWKRNSPFRSLAVFEPEDAWLFFGREAETKALMHRLQWSPVVAVVGNSGSGKSSLLRAGLIPALCEGRFGQTNGSGVLVAGESGELWRIVLIRPSASPFDYLAEVLVGQLAPELTLGRQAEFIAECRGKLSEGGDALRNAISALVFAAAGTAHTARRARVLLVVDQFEELFTLTGQQAVRDAYIDILLAAARCEGAILVHVVLALRADFYGHCLDHPGLSRCLESSLFNLGSMPAEQMRETIEKRLALAGGRAEPGLIDSLLEDVGAEPGNLALLEHALGQLWEQCGGPGCTFTNHAYAQMGRLRGALGRHADAVLESLDEQQQHLAQKIFLELVHLGEGAQDTRRRVAKAELQKLGEFPRIEQLLARLASSRLIATGREGEETFVEVSHEALIREWPALREWLEANREDLSLERRLEQAADEWRILSRDPGALLQGTRLAQAEDWLARHQDATEMIREHVLASVAARAQAVRRQRELEQRELRRFRWFSWTVSILLLLAAGLAWSAYRERVREESRAMAARAEEMSSQDHGQALDLAIRSWQTARTEEARRAVAKSFPEQLLVVHEDDPVETAMFSPDGERILSVSNNSTRLWNVRDGHLLAVLDQNRFVYGAAFSPNGKWLVTGGEDHIVRVWSGIDGHLLKELSGHTAEIRAAIFSPDGKLIVTAGTDKTARVWDWEAGRLLATLEGHTDMLGDVQFSPDGRRIVTTSRDATARVWDSITDRLIVVLRGHTGMLTRVNFSPNGQQIVTASDDNTARVWNSEDGRLLHILQHAGHLESARFSPDGRLIATASFDNTARIWNSSDGALIATLKHDGPVEDISFSADGRRIVTASYDHTARVWNCHNGRLLAILQGHTSQVYSAIFSASDDQVLTASEDKTVRIWNLSAGDLIATLRHQAMLTGEKFSPDGQVFATVSSEPTLHLWNTADASLRAALPAQSGHITRVAFSPDGKMLVAANTDGTARVWSSPDGRVLEVLQGHTGAVSGVEFSPDGRQIVTSSLDHTARNWRSADGQLVAVLKGHTAEVHTARFSPDGARIVTASEDQTARVWSAADGRLLFTLQGHSGKVVGSEFSPDGKRVLTASVDGTARVWSAADGSLLATLRAGPLEGAMFSPDGRNILTFGYEVRLWNSSDAHLEATLEGHTDRVFAADFSPDGQHILTASADNTARVWNRSDGHLEHTLQGHTYQVIRAAFFPGGKRMITASLDHTARIWEILTLDDIERILSQ